jgi:hypothetical protein
VYLIIKGTTIGKLEMQYKVVTVKHIIMSFPFRR